jgi:hypothetical protein
VSVHELGHTLGLNHTSNDIPDYTGGSYGNPWDPMSAKTVGYASKNVLNLDEAPNYTAANLGLLNVIPSQRIRSLAIGDAKETVLLSAVNRPATVGYLEARVVRPDGTYISVEYREPSGFDRSIPRATAIIHRVKPEDNGVKLRDGQDGVFDGPGNRITFTRAERQPGESYDGDAAAVVKVISFDDKKHIAEIEITPAASL